MLDHVALIHHVMPALLSCIFLDRSGQVASFGERFPYDTFALAMRAAQAMAGLESFRNLVLVVECEVGAMSAMFDVGISYVWHDGERVCVTPAPPWEVTECESDPEYAVFCERHRDEARDAVLAEVSPCVA